VNRETDEPWSWRYEAKCGNPKVYPAVTINGVDYPEGELNTELFFPPRDKEAYKPIADAAKAICLGKDGGDECPVRKECLLYALETDEQHGVFGGMSHRERNALLRRKSKHHPSVGLEDYLWNQLN
jgi:hypothetical protein